jgi:Predicted ATPase
MSEGGKFSGPREWYQHLIGTPEFVDDAEQWPVVEKLQRLHDDLVEFKNYRQTLLARTFGNRPAPRGLYLYGGVGRGKSLLMEGFFSTLPYRRKKRLHFHEFMEQVHERMRQLQGQEDPLRGVAAEWIVETRILCFDEFFVNDIADALILQRLLTALIDWGAVLVLTSNFAPEALYPGGLHRDRFFPTIALLRERLDVVPLAGDVDHRQHPDQPPLYYHFPINEVTRRVFTEQVMQACPHAEAQTYLVLMGRVVPVQRMAGRVVWFDFSVLCVSHRSQRDYLELVESFDTFFVSDVPCLTVRHQDAVRRLIWLVDILYDRGLRLIMLADAPPSELYPDGMINGEFLRTASRLQEMQGAHWPPPRA